LGRVKSRRSRNGFWDACKISIKINNLIFMPFF